MRRVWASTRSASAKACAAESCVNRSQGNVSVASSPESVSTCSAGPRAWRSGAISARATRRCSGGTPAAISVAICRPGSSLFGSGSTGLWRERAPCSLFWFREVSPGRAGDLPWFRQRKKKEAIVCRRAGIDSVWLMATRRCEPPSRPRVYQAERARTLLITHRCRPRAGG